jgi:hypothetical protein
MNNGKRFMYLIQRKHYVGNLHTPFCSTAMAFFDKKKADAECTRLNDAAEEEAESEAEDDAQELGVTEDHYIRYDVYSVEVADAAENS